MAAELPPGFTRLRDHQVTAIEEAVELFQSGIDIVYMDAPTGSGKTLIGHQIARELEAQALYVCSDKSLQDQFARDFPHGKVLKGRANYPVGGEAYQGKTAADCTIVDKRRDQCLFCGDWQTCPYEKAKGQALAADLAVTNTNYLLTEANGPGAFSGRDLVIVDEADTLESILMGYVEYRAPVQLVKKVGMQSPKKGVHKKTLVAWLNDFVAKLEQKAGQQTLIPDPDEVKQVKYAIMAARKVRAALEFDMQRGADDEDKGTWLRDYDYKATDPGLILKPVKVNTFGVQNLWKHGQRWLLMSATIISADEMSDSLGAVGDYATVSVPMTFPVENRPVILAPIADVTYKNMDEAILDLAHAIRVASERHPGERMIVHTVSYKLAQQLEDELLHGKDKLSVTRKIVTYTEGRGRERALELYKRTPGAVMLAPSMSRGIDLPGDMCRVQIIAKCPFPALGDKQIAARLHTEGGQMWYTVKTIRDIVQMTGRAVRHEEDWAVTYIFDRSFGRNLWSKWKRLFPEWWRESVDTRSDVREFIRRDR
jgi:ATP-dependent DNA helicase DinG